MYSKSSRIARTCACSTGRSGAGGGHGGLQHAWGPALIDDETPTPEHARFSLVRLLRVVVVGAVLWLVPMGLLRVVYGWDHTLT